MRYLLLTYYRKPTGKIDEAMTLSRNLKLQDRQMANVILDFKTLSVLKCSMDGVVVPKDWDRIVSYYYRHYSATIERLFTENGHEIKIQKSETADPG
jgi:hypothetical protein